MQHVAQQVVDQPSLAVEQILEDEGHNDPRRDDRQVVGDAEKGLASYPLIQKNGDDKCQQHLTGYGDRRVGQCVENSPAEDRVDQERLVVIQTHEVALYWFDDVPVVEADA